MSVCHGEVEFTETARTAVGGNRTLDQRGCSDVRVRWQIPKGLVAMGRQVPVITLEQLERLCGIVIVGGASYDGRAGGERNGDESEDGEAFHACCWMSKANQSDSPATQPTPTFIVLRTVTRYQKGGRLALAKGLIRGPNHYPNHA